MTYTWLLFDLDGTLLDYDAAEAAALKESLEESDVAMTGDLADVYRRVNRALWRKFEAGEVDAKHIRTQRFHELVETLDIDVDPEELSERYIRHLAASTHVRDGAREIVADLAEDHRIAIVTNGLADVQWPRLRATGFDELAEVIVISDEVGVSKPDPAFFDLAFERMGQPDREETIVIGDGLTSDIAGGVTYGIDTCWVNHAGQDDRLGLDITYEITELDELPPILR
ncbi:MAG: YjjG family noncanonical pyrimidine nucleotidase [Nitriliruptorales bacterium]|nr:YjjG family noncanonical pyrimidine nucleotidase [Nitriliruptorales bacterium]